MPIVPLPGVQLFYEDEGDPTGEPMLLVMGFSAQLTAWPDGFLQELRRRRFRLIRVDNRDCGRSTHLDGVDVNPFEVDPAKVPYLLSDMADDLVRVLDHLSIDRTHLVGVSMGGMIGQTLALEHPGRVRSLCSIMSTTGGSTVGQPTNEALMAVLAPPPTDREGVIERAAVIAAVIGSRTHPPDPVDARRRAGDAYDRAYYPEGAGRQLAAMLASGDRTERLGQVRLPTLVVHGLQDTLIQPDGGRATASAIPGAELIELADMGHDLPVHLWPQLADAIAKNAGRG